MNIVLFSDNDKHNDKIILNNPSIVNHIKTILSAQVGDTIRVGQLNGWLGVAVIDGLGEQVCLKHIVLDKPPPKKLPITVVLALPRPKVLRRLIMDMTAAGVAHIILVNSYCTDKSYWQSPLLARLDEFVLEGLSQGVDTIPPIISLEKRFKPFVQDRLTNFGSSIAVFHPYHSQPISDYLKTNTPTTIVIGAEGGFINYEIELLRACGASVVGLGSRILRTEAAVNAVLGRFL